MKRLVMNSNVSGGVSFDETGAPDPKHVDAVIDVKAFSLNRGELGFAASGEGDGNPIGWDVAGIVSQQAADGSGPAEGTRVVGFSRPMNGWAEQVALPTSDIAALPDDISFELASTLPVAGLTAQTALARGGFLFGQRVLITGATGGVGSFSVQIAKASGAHVTGQVRRESQIDSITRLGADEVVVTDSGTELDSQEPFDLIVDGVSGAMFPSLVRNLAAGGTLVAYGVTAGYDAQFAAYPDLFGNGARRNIYGLSLYTELQDSSSFAVTMPRLLRQVQLGTVTPEISRTEDWSKTAELAQGLFDRTFSGKAVLTL